MAKRKVTLSLPDHTVNAAKAVAPGGDLSAFTARALRAETLRAQLRAAGPLPEVTGWLDDSEVDESDVA